MKDYSLSVFQHIPDEPEQNVCPLSILFHFYDYYELKHIKVHSWIAPIRVFVCQFKRLSEIEFSNDNQR